MKITNKVSDKFRFVPIGLLGVALVSVGVWSTTRLAGVAAFGQSDLERQVVQIIKDNPEVIIESVKTYQRQQQEEQKKAAEAARQQLISNPQSFISDSPTSGSQDPKIILVEFSDFQCPFCSKARETLKEFMAANGKDVTLVYKHLPLEQIHPEATPAAQASWAAAQQGKFWEFHDALFEHQDKLGDAFYIKTAKRLNLNLPKFNSDRKSNAAKAAIQKDIEIAKKLGISGTPYFLINGIELSGAVPLQDFNQALRQAKQELAASKE